jgi:periplasmic protein TonB
MEANRILTMSLQDIVFDGRNKSYGAYELRSAYEKRLLKALVIGFLIIVFSAVAPYAYACLTSVISPKTETTSCSVDLTPKVIEIPPSPKSLPKTPPPPPKSTIIFLPPVIKQDDEVKVEKPPIENDKLVDDISNKTQVVDNQTIEVPEVDNGSATESKIAPIETKDEILEVALIEQSAEFPGGTTELMKWLSNNVKYPSYAREAGIHGRVVLKFIVEKDGSISQVKTLKGVHELLDNEAVRVTKSMPTWKAGRQGGRAVRCYFTLPINFTLQ